MTNSWEKAVAKLLEEKNVEEIQKYSEEDGGNLVIMFEGVLDGPLDDEYYDVYVEIWVEDEMEDTNFIMTITDENDIEKDFEYKLLFSKERGWYCEEVK